MKPDWVERRKETALRELGQAREELLSCQRRAAGPMESDAILGMLALVQSGIDSINEAERSNMPRWLRGILYGLPVQTLGSRYRKTLRMVRTFDVEEIASTPDVVVEQIAQWHGDADVGLATLQAAYHADELYRITGKADVRDVLAVVAEIADTKSDPNAEPGNSDLARRWSTLSDAIALADISYSLLKMEPQALGLEEALSHAEKLGMYLRDAQSALQESHESQRRTVVTDNGEEIDVASRGRDLYHNRVRYLVNGEKGQVVVIDVKSGAWEVDDDDATATLRLLERCPDAITWAERVGYPAVHRAEHRIVPSVRAP